MVVTLLVGVGYLACLGLFVWAMATAPAGHEDETGFHFGDGSSSEPHTDRPLARPAGPAGRRWTRRFRQRTRQVKMSG